jgi:Zn finger protein HypA/HybF involved in hydrogenase expression
MRTYVRMGQRRKQFDWAAMQAYIDAGNGFIRCRTRFGIAHATWMKAIRAGDIRVSTEGKPYADARKRFNWAEVQAHYDRGATVRMCMSHFGFSAASWTKAVRRGALKPRSVAFTFEEALRSKSRLTIKRHLLRAGILKNRCDWCGLTSWRGRPIAIQIDHINGIRDDHRVENLRMLCPNCHSQTETFAARNLKFRVIPE